MFKYVCKRLLQSMVTLVIVATTVFLLLRLMPEGGVLISDNVLQDGDLIESRYAVERRNRTIHSRMREYLYALTHMEELETSVLPIGDGVTVSVKKSAGRQTDPAES